MTSPTDDLVFACMDLDLPALRAALDAGAAVNAPDHERRRPVSHVLYDGADERSGRSPEQREQDRATALTMLLEHGARLDRKDPKGLTAYERITEQYPLCAQAYLRHVGPDLGLATARRHLSSGLSALTDNADELAGWWAHQAAVVSAERLSETLATPKPEPSPSSRAPRL